MYLEPCTEKDVAQRKAQCEAILDSCFTQSTVGRRVQDFFHENVRVSVYIMLVPFFSIVCF